MLDDTQVVEVSVEQNVEQKNEVAVVDVNGGVSDALNDLRKKASAQYTLQKTEKKDLT